MDFLAELSLILMSTAIGGHVLARLGLPAVMGQLVMGILIGPALFNWVSPHQLITVFAEIGVVLLMFMAGLESNLGQLRRYLKPALLVAVSGVVFPVMLMGGMSLVFGYHFQEALFIGVVFSATSVSISVVVLQEFKALDTQEGATILGAAVADDILGVLLLSLMVVLIKQNTSTQASPSILLQVSQQILFLAGVFIVVRWGAPWVMKLSAQLLIPYPRTIAALVVCFVMAYVAEQVGLSGAIGAFFAGVAIGQTSVAHEVDTTIQPISNAIFVPIFFANIGLIVRFDRLEATWLFIIVMTLLAVLTKWWGGSIGARLAGLDRLSSQAIGAGMIARGEMALITAQIGFQAQLLQKDLYVDLILVIVLATLIAPLSLRFALMRQQHQ